MDLVDWDETVNLHSNGEIDAGLLSNARVLGGERIIDIPLARAVKVVMEDWIEHPLVQEAAWITRDSGSDIEFAEIQSLYVRPDFPRQGPKE